MEDAIDARAANTKLCGDLGRAQAFRLELAHLMTLRLCRVGSSRPITSTGGDRCARRLGNRSVVVTITRSATLRNQS
jgi:hypothetical protein